MHDFSLILFIIIIIVLLLISIQLLYRFLFSLSLQQTPKNVNENTRISWGFVICRHVNQKEVNQYWKECIRNIRRFHPSIRIVVIDDYSDPDMLDIEEETQILAKDPLITIVHSEYKGVGEILGYYYFYKHRWFDYAMIIHDSVFLNSSMKVKVNNVSNIAFLWSFRSRSHDNNQVIDHYLHLLKGHNKLFSQKKSEKWKGCFGVMSYIRLGFLDQLVEDHQLFDILLPRIKTREDRMAMERVLSIVVHAHLDGKHADSFFGDIHDYCRWGHTFVEYKNKELDNLPIIKVWTGR